MGAKNLDDVKYITYTLREHRLIYCFRFWIFSLILASNASPHIYSASRTSSGQRSRWTI